MGLKKGDFVRFRHEALRTGRPNVCVSSADIHGMVWVIFNGAPAKLVNASCLEVEPMNVRAVRCFTPREMDTVVAWDDCPWRPAR